jgi:hypothetical protein
MPNGNIKDRDISSNFYIVASHNKDYGTKSVFKTASGTDKSHHKTFPISAALGREC